MGRTRVCIADPFHCTSNDRRKILRTYLRLVVRPCPTSASSPRECLCPSTHPTPQRLRIHPPGRPNICLRRGSSDRGTKTMEAASIHVGEQLIRASRDRGCINKVGRSKSLLGWNERLDSSLRPSLIH